MNDDADRPRARTGSQQTAHDMLELLSLLAWLSHCRCARGEYLHAQRYLGDAVDELLRMLRRFAATDGHARICLAVPRRRLGAHSPALARELLEILLGATAAPEARLLEIAEQRLRPHLPSLEWSEVARLRERIQNAGMAARDPSDRPGRTRGLALVR